MISTRAVLAAVLASASVWAQPVITLQPDNAKPGDPVLVRIRTGAAVATGKLGDKALGLYPVKGGFEAIEALPLEQKPGPLPLALELGGADGGVETFHGALEVVPPAYPSRELKVAARFTEKPTPEIQAQLDADKIAFADAFAQPFGPRHFTRNFGWPRPPKITAPFGDLRLFNGAKQSQHYGTDLDGKMGAPIVAANDGTVVLARGCYTSGNTVILSHGGGLFTLYFHMSKMQVAKGQKVKQGQRLGLVGRTGRVTGPHLHWGAKIGELYVDAATLLKLDFAK